METNNNNKFTWTYKQKAKYLDDGIYTDDSNGQRVTREDLERIYGEDANMTVNASGDESAYDEWHSAHPIPLPEVEVVAKAKPSPADTRNWLERKLGDGVQSFKNSFNMTFDPIIGEQRTQLYSKAMDRDPNFSTNWDMANNISEFINYITAGLLNRLSPTQNVGLAIDAFKGKNIGQSWMGNSGIVPDQVAEEHPYWALIANLIGDLGLYKGTSSLREWGTTPKLIGSGAESEVYSAPFSNHVIKYSTITPEEMRMMQRVPGFAKTEYLGQASDGRYIYKQQKLVVPKNQYQELRQMVDDTRHFKAYPYDGDDLVFANPSNDMYFVDGQVGKSRFTGIRKFIDGSMFDEQGFIDYAYKKGGKLIEKNGSNSKRP